MVSKIQFCLLVGFFAGPLLSVANAADPPSPEMARAEELYQNGAVLYEEGNYQGAILAFQSSFNISHSPALYYNIANCYERLGQLQDAKDALNMYRAVAPADERDRLDRRIANLDARIAEEAQRAATTPPNPPTTTPQNVAASSPPPATASKPSPNGAKWVLIGTGAAVGLGGGAMAVVGYLDAQDARAANDREQYDSDRLLNGLGLGFAGAGLATAIIGIVLPVHGQTVSVSSVPMHGGLTMVATIPWPTRNNQ